MTARQHARDESERLYLATEAADLAEVTEDPGRPDGGDSWFTGNHNSDKGIAERERGWDRGEK